LKYETKINNFTIACVQADYKYVHRVSLISS